ncbi:MAG TPA: response regulator transcription factor [Gemmatimonadaceae bacterium]|nr:response regulator transcription factor [Gemmatimonadaceae bacterium]
MTQISVLAADDHELIRFALEETINAQPDMRLTAHAANGEEALERYREHRPDVVLMDLQMPIMGGLAAIAAIIAEFPAARIVALTTYDGDEDIHRALSAGAKGYLLKEMLRKEMIAAIRKVHAGQRAIPHEVAARLAEFTPRIELTGRELEVLQLLAKGMTNSEIGAVIGRTTETVKVHVRNILQKLGASDRTEAVTTAIQRGFLRLP